MTDGENALGVPRFCGAIGDYDAAKVGRVAANLNPPAREVHRDGDSILCADRTPSRWRGETTWGLAFPEREPDRADQARGWEEAAASGAAGIWADGASPAVHASSSGLAPIYWMRAGRAVYFATRIDALARAEIAPVSVDWQAWGSILTLNFCLEGRTPFAEIARLGAHGTLRLADGAPLVTEPGLPWLDEEPLACEEAAERIVAALRSEAEALEPHGPIVCPLTGGWDSRLIACALAERDLIAATYTVGSAQGNDQEVRLATTVADALGVPHTVVDPELPPFAEELATAAERVEYQSLPHLVIHRLERCLPAGAICTDGIGGSLIKGRCLRPEILDAPDPIAATFDTLASQRARSVYDDQAWAALRESSREAFLRENGRFPGFHAPPSPAVYNRSRCAHGSSPVAIVGRRNRLFMPLISDGVARPALAAPPLERGDKSLFRAVLRHLRPEVGRLPSTNDTPRPRRERRPTIRMPDARAAHLTLLAGSPLRPWFSARMERLIRRGAMAPIDGRDRAVRQVQAICMFGLWSERYAGVIGETEPAELLGAPPARALSESTRTA